MGIVSSFCELLCDCCAGNKKPAGGAWRVEDRRKQIENVILLPLKMEN